LERDNDFALIGKAGLGLLYIINDKHSFNIEANYVAMSSFSYEADNDVKLSPKLFTIVAGYKYWFD
ncbi:MAG: hypothetical protein LBV04_04740, partial [Deferribacteraceae bacterium]|jgi:hypothetical protein|nr:hypothetical protein [Deferribacteraceae bacterium]